MAKTKQTKAITKEMFSDQIQEQIFQDYNLQIYNNLFQNVNTTIQKTNYKLTKAIYYGQSYPLPGININFQLGTVFGKPIVNATTSFILGNPPKIKIKPSKQAEEELKKLKLNEKEEEYLKQYEIANQKIQTWFHKNFYILHRLITNVLRDGDAYFLIENSDDPKILNPENVKAILNEKGELIGYRVFSFEYKQQDKQTGRTETIVYATDYTKIPPYKRITKYDAINKNGVVVFEEDPNAFIDDIKDIPLVHWVNDREEGKIYGNSEYRNVLYPMVKYALIFEKAIVNNNTASTPLPYLTGVGDVEKFIRDNGKVTKEADGSVSYELNMDGKRVLIGSDSNFKADFASIADTTQGAERLLTLLFYLICQGAEIPEFIMGAAVKSSHASVESQLPIIIRKAQRKQIEYQDFLYNTVKLVLNSMITEIDLPFGYELEVTWGDIIDEDNKITIEIIDRLKDSGLISEDTYAAILMSRLKNQIPSPDDEIKKAKEERDQLFLNRDIFIRKINQSVQDLEDLEDQENNQTQEDE